MSSFHQIVSRLRQNTNGPLPGIAAQLRMAPSLRNGEEFSITPNNHAVQSAVLIGIFEEKDGAHTLLIKRASYNGIHSGQISFPGGKYERIDTDLMATALREAHEEVGIEPTQVEIIGKLTPLFISVSNMLVHPYVGIIPKPTALKLDAHEVEYVITPSLALLQSKNCLASKVITSHGRTIEAPYFNAENEVIWGATAMIISELIELY